MSFYLDDFKQFQIIELWFSWCQVPIHKDHELKTFQNCATKPLNIYL